MSCSMLTSTRRALFFVPRTTTTTTRAYAADLNRPRPPPLPPKEQREFEELQRKAATSGGIQPGADLSTHPDAPTPIKPDFEGEVNPTTGERGGPKREPVGKWAEEGGDWSFKGRVSDF